MTRLSRCILTMLPLFILNFRAHAAGLDAPSTEAPSAYITDTAPEFSWSAVDGAVSYELSLGDDSDTFAYFDQTGIGTNLFTIPSVTLNSAQVYHWRVRAQAADGSLSDWSEIDSFLIYDPSIVPVTGAPSGYITTIAPLFQWSAIAGATSYDLLILSEDEQTTINLIAGLTTNSFQEPTNAPLVEYTAYHYKVRSHLSDGRVSIWSDPGSFLTFNNTDLPVLIGPSVRTPLQNTLFKWMPVENAASYELQLMSEDESHIFLDSKTIPVNGFSLDPSLALPLNVVYHWRVRANLNSGVMTLWSVTSSFELFDQGDVPDPLLPFGFVTSARYIEWSQAMNPGVHNYEVSLTDADSGAVVLLTSVVGNTRLDLKPFRLKLKKSKTYSWSVRADFTDGHKSLWTLPRNFQISTTVWNGKVTNLTKTVTQKPSLSIDLNWTTLNVANTNLRYHVVLRIFDGNAVRTHWSGDASPSHLNGLTLPSALPMVTGKYEWLVEVFDVDNNQLGQSNIRRFNLVVKSPKK